MFSLQTSLSGAAISCWFWETRGSARLSFSLTAWKWGKGVWPWPNLYIQQRNIGQSRKTAAVLRGLLLGLQDMLGRQEGVPRNTEVTKLLWFIYSGLSLCQNWSTSIKEAALKTAVASFHHQEKINRKTDPSATRGMTTTLKRGLAQWTIPAVFLSCLLCGYCENTYIYL